MPEHSERIATLGWRAGTTQATALKKKELSPDLLALPGDGQPNELASGPYRGPVPSEDPDKLEIGKWAVVCLNDDAEDVAQAFAPLIEHRKSRGQLWREGVLAFKRPEVSTPSAWLRRLKKAANHKLPHYLLIAGGPDRLPFEVQFELDQIVRTGRVDAAETDNVAGGLSWEACKRYATKVANYERGEVPFERSALIYSLNSDEATELAHSEVTQPLFAAIDKPRDDIFGAAATREALAARLSSAAGPCVVFTFSHGVEFPSNAAYWGALTDHNFKGDPRTAAVTAEFVAGLERFGRGSIVFSFACFSAGVPAQSAHAFYAEDQADQISGAPMVAPLPRILLGHDGGPVAFVGHVDRVTHRSFASTAAEKGWTPYRDFAKWTLGSVGTLGQALSTIRERYLQTSAVVAKKLDDMARSASNGLLKDAWNQWLAYHDFRSFMLLGDPGLTVPGS